MTHEPWVFCCFSFFFFLRDSALNVILAFSGSAEIEIRDTCVCGAGELVYVLETATGIQLTV